MLTDALPVDQNGITLGTNIWKFFVKTVYLFFSNQIKEKHLEKQLVNDIEIYPQTKNYQNAFVATSCVSKRRNKIMCN